MAYGLRPVRHLFGGVVRLNEYTIDTSYNTNLYRGDPLKIVTGGTIEIAAPNSSTQNLGVFWGVQYTASDGSVNFKRYWDSPSGATNILALVYDDPNILFAVQADQDGTALVQADVGGNIDLVSGTGSTLSGLSGWYLDSSAGVGSGAAQVRLMGKLGPAWTAAGTAMDVLVKFNEHALTTTTGI